MEGPSTSLLQPQSGVSVPLPPSGAAGIEHGPLSARECVHRPTVLQLPPSETAGRSYDRTVMTLEGMPFQSINGQTREIYINAGQWPEKLSSIGLARPDAGHSDDMTKAWQKAERSAPGLQDRVVSLLNVAAQQAKSYVAAQVLVPEEALKLNAPSFLLHGDGGMPHIDAVEEWSFLLALRAGAGTKVFKGTHDDATRRVCQMLGVAERELLCSSGNKYVNMYAPLMLPRWELEAQMEALGSGGLLSAGQMAVLPPGCVHETPVNVSLSQPRAMLFFTIVVECHDGQRPKHLYDPEHQVLPMDALAIVVTHDFFPNSQDQCMDALLQSYVAWASHPKYADAFSRRVVETAPAVNRKAAESVEKSIKAILQARKTAQNTAWSACAPYDDEDRE